MFQLHEQKRSKRADFCWHAWADFLFAARMEHLSAANQVLSNESQAIQMVQVLSENASLAGR